jgi:sugar phosphate isomerase/epimerase
VKLGFNTVLFQGHSLEDAFRVAAVAGYDGVELSAIKGMAEHLPLPGWSEAVPTIKGLADEHGLELLAIEQPSLDAELMLEAFKAAEALGIGIVNCGPGGKSGDEASLEQSIEQLRGLGAQAGEHGVTLCVKAHVGAAVWDTPTSLRVLEAIELPSFGLDMDPSHIHRAGENPVDALQAVVDRIRHVHIRDCKGDGPSPGDASLQANGRGDIDLLGFIRVLHTAGYQGPVDLEVIGAGDYDLVGCAVIAAESRGHMQASLQGLRCQVGRVRRPAEHRHRRGRFAPRRSPRRARCASAHDTPPRRLRAGVRDLRTVLFAAHPDHACVREHAHEPGLLRHRSRGAETRGSPRLADAA